MTVKFKDLLGRNMKRLRIERGMSMSELGKEAAALGVSWNSARIAAIEGGTAAVTLENLCVIMWALNRHDGSVSLADLMHGREDEAVEVNDGLRLRGDVLASLLSGSPDHLVLTIEASMLPPDSFLEAAMAGIKKVDLGYRIPLKVARRARVMAGQSDRDNARKMGMSMTEFLAACVLLWKHPMSEEVRLRAGDGATPQAKGRLVRKTKVELQEFIDSHNGELPTWRELHVNEEELLARRKEQFPGLFNG